MTVAIISSAALSSSQENALAQLIIHQLPYVDYLRWVWPEPVSGGEPQPEQLLPALETLYREHRPQWLLFAPDALGLALATRLAVRLAGSCFSDINLLNVRNNQIERGCYSNGLRMRTTPTHFPCCLTAAPRPGLLTLPSDIPTMAVSLGPPPEWLLSSTSAPQAAPQPLAAACRVLALGGGAGSLDAVVGLSQRAAQVGLQTGASRQAIMSGWYEWDTLIGMSGAQLAPDICLIAGISGAPAFMQGVRHSNFIVAINSDPAAAVFAEADVGIVGNLHEVLPALFKLINSES